MWQSTNRLQPNSEGLNQAQGFQLGYNEPCASEVAHNISTIHITVSEEKDRHCRSQEPNAEDMACSAQIPESMEPLYESNLVSSAGSDTDHVRI